MAIKVTELLTCSGENDKGTLNKITTIRWFLRGFTETGQEWIRWISVERPIPESYCFVKLLVRRCQSLLKKKKIVTKSTRVACNWCGACFDFSRQCKINGLENKNMASNCIKERACSRVSKTIAYSPFYFETYYPLWLVADFFLVTTRGNTLTLQRFVVAPSV